MRRVLGTTIIELLVVLAVIMVVGIMVLHTVELDAAARRVAGDVRAERARAIVTSTVSACWLGRVLELPIDVRVPPRGLLFTPDGLPRTCDGGGVGNTTILLEHRGRQAAVIVSSLGRVRWELR